MGCTNSQATENIETGCHDWKAQMEAGRLAFEKGFFAAALRNYKKALALQEDLELGDEFRACTLLKIGQCHRKLCFFKEAETNLQEVLRLDQSSLDPHGYDVAVDLSELAMVYAKRGLLDQAEDLLKQSVSILERSKSPSAPAIVQALSRLGIILCQEGLLTDAKQCLDKAICLCSSLGNNAARMHAKILFSMATLAMARGAIEEAHDFIEQAIEETEMATGGIHPDLADMLDLASEISNRAGRLYESADCHSRAQAIRRHLHDIDS